MEQTTASVSELLAKEPWFHGLLPREDVVKMLSKVGDYLMRTSETVAGAPRHLIVSLQVAEGEDGAKHYVVNLTDGKFSIAENKTFDTVLELMEAYKTTPIDESVPKSMLTNPVTRQFWELSHEDIKLTKTLGEGAFGEVKKGTFKTEKGEVDVAVKVAKLETCTKEQIKEIMAEARLMRNFDHKNVVKCYGVAAMMEPLYLVMELVSGGGLDGYLQKNKVPMSEKVDIILQVAQGIEYLHEIPVIHRDLAARNVLYGSSVAKVSDFGQSRNGTVYKMVTKSKVPVKWLAPETLQIQVYTLQSDVYTFGILCWEILENGSSPYPGMSVADVHSKVLSEDYRMSISSEAPPEVSEMIKKAWLTKPHERPSMASVVTTMKSIKTPEGCIVPPQPKSNSRNSKFEKSKNGGVGNAGRKKKSPLKMATSKGKSQSEAVTDQPADNKKNKSREEVRTFKTNSNTNLKNKSAERVDRNNKSKEDVTKPAATPTGASGMRSNISKLQLDKVALKKTSRTSAIKALRGKKAGKK